MRDRQQILNSLRNQDTNYDVVVIGGGITGSGVARDAAARGLKVLVVEQNDFASGASSKSGKLIHGGLRYLKNGHLKLVFESCSERHTLRTIVAPHLIHPVRFVFPFFKNSHTPRWLMAIGLFVYDLLSLYRNYATFSFWNSIQLNKFFPKLLTKNVQGALSYFDSAALDFRLTIDTLKASSALGADLLNYVELKSIDFTSTSNGEATVKLTLFDRLMKKNGEGHNLIINTKVALNVTGPWADQVLAKSPVAFRFQLKTTSGIHFIIPNQLLKLEYTLSFEHPKDFRPIYLVPWKDKVLIGTTDLLYHGDLENLVVPEESIQYLIEGIHFYFPEAKIERSHIQRIMMGVRPLIGGGKNAQEEAKIPRDFEIHIDPRGLASMTGGKLTTYRSMAQKYMDMVVSQFFPRHISHKNLTKRPLEVAADNLINQSKNSTPKIIINLPLIKMTEDEINEILHHEWVESLGDFLFRRTDLGIFHLESLSIVLTAIRPYFITVKNWSEERWQSEVRDCERELNK